MQNVGKFHVDGQHGSRVLHNPVLIHVWCIVITRRSENIQKGVVLLSILEPFREIAQVKGSEIII